MTTPGEAAAEGPQETTLGSLVLSLYAPGTIYALGQGAVIPVIALMARDLGASLPLAGVIVGLRGVGTLVGDVPAGELVDRLGARRSVLLATLVLAASGAGAAVSRSPWTLAVAVFAMGVGWALWLVARLTFATEAVPADRRGRGIATLGGTNRMGNFAGPLLGAGVIKAVGTPGAFWLEAAAVAVGCALMLATTRGPQPSNRTARRPGTDWRKIVVDSRGALLGPGMGALAISALRTARQALIPLWGAHIGVDAADVSLIFGGSSGLDMVLFAPAGYASDRWGRKVIAVSCLGLLSVGHLLVPLTRDFPELLGVGLFLGFANGVGSGIKMTMGADLAPVAGRAAFLGLWRFVGDVGTAGGPFLLSAAIAASSLTPASLVLGVLGLAATTALRLRMPEPSGRYPPSEPE